ncbi:glycosyltransferase [Thiohalorhabdus sp.]|uniref:glycosyltransferase n=1 Tax=Thiohalorhabdus sp. TaxID=3094134 RepID=UPI002FC27FC2
MQILIELVAGLGAAVWVGLWAFPGQPWRARPRLEADSEMAGADLSDITAVIPARDEAPYIGTALASLAAQGEGLAIVVVDDHSRDGTAEAARAAGEAELAVVPGEPLPEGWSGKVWALEQGRARTWGRYLLLMDADIEMAPGMLAVLRDRLEHEGAGLVSLMAALRTEGKWERLLILPFLFFFRVLYPFDRVSRRDSRVAAAAGGCLLLDRQALEDAGGFAPLRSAVIDDCALARRIKDQGYPLWLGLTRSVRSLRPYQRLGEVWAMVARTAFTQLGYSAALLGLATLAMAAVFWGPSLGLVWGVFGGQFTWAIGGALGILAMAAVYSPTLAFYGRSRWWSLTLPLAGTLFLAMTWTSAWRYWRGVRSRWKGRTYGRSVTGPSAEGDR